MAEKKKKVKQSTKKKTTAKSKVTKKTGPPKKNLLKQLTTVIKDLDEEGLLFLIRQAQILQYNMHVDQINEKKSKTRKAEVETGQSQSSKKTIEIIESKNSKSFILVINGARNFFSLEEMKKIVKLCHVSDDTTDACKRLYNWFTKNRLDLYLAI